jgi:ribonuclease G
MTKELFISSSPHETKVAVLEDDQLVELHIERDVESGLVGGIYKGRVSRVLPGMQSAFVDIGLDRDAFLYVSDFYEDEEEYEKVFTEAETRATKYVERGQSVAPAEEAAAPPASEAVPPPAAPVAEAPAASEPAPPAEAPSRTAPPSGESRDFRRRDFGRRRRRRGRGGFDRPDRRPPFRERDHDRGPAPEGPRGFELLPGESLAKYGQAPAAEPPQDAGEETPSGAGEEFETRPWLEDQPQAELSSFEAGSSEAATDTFSGSPAGETEVPFTPATFASTELEPPRPAEEAEPSFGAVEPAVETAEPPAPQELSDDTRRFDARDWSLHAAGAGPAETATQAPAEIAEEAKAESHESREPEEIRRAAEAAADLDEVESNEEEAEDETGTSGEAPAEEPAEVATAPESGGETSEKGEAPAQSSYTLRERHQRPHFAPRRRRGRRGGGRMRHHERREPSRPGNNQPVQIADVLKEGQEILVQIAKEPLGSKGARITSHIALPGRYLVYMPTISHIGVSRKISSEEERLRLRNIILENKGALGGGFIARTAAAGRSDDELKADLRFLSTLWGEIRAKAEKTKAPALLHRDLQLVERILRDILSPEFKAIRVDNELDYERVVEFVNRCQPSLVGRVRLYTRPTPMFEEFGIQQEIEKALRPKVWLRSGGYIVINQTEALVAVDVNTGKFVGKTNRLEDTIVKTNVDAVNEIVRQLRLRDLGGIIVIDFIDMDERRNRYKVVQALEEALRRDRAPTKVLSFNDFGLVAITRKRVRQSLERSLCQPCPYCSGAGWVKSVATVCYEILGEIRKMAGELEGDTLTLRVNPEVAQALKARQGVLLAEIESLTRKDVIVKGDPAVHMERFEIY